VGVVATATATAAAVVVVKNCSPQYVTAVKI
jgi:hypothetical protein